MAWIGFIARLNEGVADRLATLGAGIVSKPGRTVIMSLVFALACCGGLTFVEWEVRYRDHSPAAHNNVKSKNSRPGRTSLSLLPRAPETALVCAVPPVLIVCAIGAMTTRSFVRRGGGPGGGQWTGPWNSWRSESTYHQGPAQQRQVSRTATIDT